MYVIKRKGYKEAVNFDKIHKRIKFLIKEPYPLEHINDAQLAQLVIQGLKNNMPTKDIDTYTANLAADLSTNHIEYNILAGRIVIDNHHKNTLTGYEDKVKQLYMRRDANDKIYPVVSDDFYKFVKANQYNIDKYIDYSRDYLSDFFSFRTLEKGYLLNVDGQVIERPQDLYMRVAIYLYMKGGDLNDPIALKKIFKVYDRISNHYYTHATPTLFNSGTPKGQTSSCFLLGSHDSREGIMKTLNDCTQISKWSGGIGLHTSMWRASGSLIRGTNGKSNGIIPFLRLYNDAARAFNQGGKRLGSFAVYLEPHHPDIINFLKLRKTHGDENLRCRDLFLAMWLSDLFMERVRDDAEWSTFCPDVCPGLNTSWGDKYKKLYLEYELAGKAHTVYKARDIWKAIYESQKESGLPYINYKDTINKTSMQSNLGTISSSNLCSEILEFSNNREYAMCILASICLPKFVKDSYSEEELKLSEKERRPLDHNFPIHPIMDYKELAIVAGELVENLNNVIDRNWNPVIETARSNYQHRPIGIGIQGLADVFLKFRVGFESNEAAILNKKIAETIYYGTLTKSTELCRMDYKNIIEIINKDGSYKHNIIPNHVLDQYPLLEEEYPSEIYTNVEDVPKTIGAYSSYLSNGGSPLSRGVFHWELYGLEKKDLSGMFDWESLRMHIQIFGVKNSLLVAYMPTASTSEIMGCSPCFEPYMSNIYKRKTLVGEYIIINKYLMNDLQRYNLWSEDVKNYLSVNNGSIRGIEGIPDHIKELYKTVWEIKQKTIINLAADRQPFIDQSQSMNLFVEDLTYKKFNSMQFYAWSKQLKTGCYYLRSRAAITPQKFTIDPEIQRQIELRDQLLEQEKRKTIDMNEEEEICLVCSA